MLSGKVIDAANRFAAPASIRPVAAYWTPDDIRRLCGPSIKLLPFVTMKDGNPIAGATSYWNDIPTGNGHADFKRGNSYALLTMQAIIADGCGPHYLQCIIEAMIHDAVVRRAKGRKRSRRLPPAVDGFLFELSRQLCSAFTGKTR